MMDSLRARLRKQSQARDYFRYHYRVVYIDRREGYLIMRHNYAAK